jgi:inorganic pyrophosphatase
VILDVLLISDEPTFAGCIVPARLVGVLEAEQAEDEETIRNDRLVAVIETPYNSARYESIDQINEQVLEEVEHFFVAYNEAEGRQFKPLGRRGPERARNLLNEAVKRRSHK